MKRLSMWAASAYLVLTASGFIAWASTVGCAL